MRVELGCCPLGIRRLFGVKKEEEPLTGSSSFRLYYSNIPDDYTSEIEKNFKNLTDNELNRFYNMKVSITYMKSQPLEKVEEQILETKHVVTIIDFITKKCGNEDSPGTKLGIKLATGLDDEKRCYSAKNKLAECLNALSNLDYKDKKFLLKIFKISSSEFNAESNEKSQARIDFLLTKVEEYQNTLKV